VVLLPLEVLHLPRRKKKRKRKRRKNLMKMY
jgi:hypothetical protein